MGKKNKKKKHPHKKGKGSRPRGKSPEFFGDQGGIPGDGKRESPEESSIQKLVALEKKYIDREQRYLAMPKSERNSHAGKLLDGVRVLVRKEIRAEKFAFFREDIVDLSAEILAELEQRVKQLAEIGGGLLDRLSEEVGAEKAMTDYSQLMVDMMLITMPQTCICYCNDKCDVPKVEELYDKRYMKLSERVSRTRILDTLNALKTYVCGLVDTGEQHKWVLEQRVGVFDAGCRRYGDAVRDGQVMPDEAGLGFFSKSADCFEDTISSYASRIEPLKKDVQLLQTLINDIGGIFSANPLPAAAATPPS